MKFLISSKQDSETGADNYEELEMKNFKSRVQAANYVTENYNRKSKLYELIEITVNFKRETKNKT